MFHLNTITMKTRHIIAAVTMFLFSQAIHAQETFRLDPETSKITIEGTSSMHDWEMEVTEILALMKVKKEKSRIDNITAVEITIPTEALKSKNSLMDKKTYNALRSDKHEKISFTLNDVNNLSNSGQTLTGTALGTLSVAGLSKTVSIPFRGEIKKDLAIQLKGTEKINMKDFNISPPTAMMGTMKTGEEVTVHFDVLFRPETVYSEMVLPGKN
jgi:polyisoprenoid-binding protein YceI